MLKDGDPTTMIFMEGWSVRSTGDVNADRDLGRRYAERAVPHRIVKWETSKGEKADLLASERMKYWQMNGPGGELNLKRLKLSPRPRRTT